MASDLCSYLQAQINRLGGPGVVGYSMPLNRLYPLLNRRRLGYTPGYIMA